ncbi:MAG TPA: methionyl-tRNA formyltransferase [Propionicimonas sp.]|uniref:methionyl-tRNA formyltransferase n=1 Tax=Propionicimonas sp. TaxID=1955623 RepID=UPI002F3F464B
MRLVFAGTPRVAADTLTRLLADGGHEVAAVLTRPDAPQGRSSRPVPSPVAQLAAEHGIEVLRPTRASDPALAARLAELAPDCCPVVAYGGLIPRRLLDLPRHGWVNVHFSLLPRWRGAAPVQHAILAGDEVTGVTVFELVEALDAGPVLASAEYRLTPAETSGEALDALQELGAKELIRTLDGLAAGTITAVPQPEDGVTLAPKLTVPSARIDWTRPAAEISRQVRANNPSPVAWTELDEERFRVLLAVPADGDGDLAPGELRAGKRSVLVGTGSGPLELLVVQPSGRRPTAAADWGRGLRGERRFA